jgi:hypothetical protein
LERIWKGPWAILRHYVANCLERWEGKTKEHAEFKKNLLFITKITVLNLKNTFHQKI